MTRPYFACLGLIASLYWLSFQPALAISRESEWIGQYRAKAVEAQFRNNYDLAIENYNEAAKLASQAYGANSPFLAEIYYDMGSLALSNSQFKNAEEWLNNSVRLNPNSSAGHLKLAELQMVKGQPDEAVKQASLVVSKHRDDVVAHQQLALALQRNDETLKSYREFSASEALIRIERARYEGKTPPPAFSIPFFSSSAATPAPAAVKPAPPKAAPKSPLDAKKAAEAAKKAAAADSLKKAQEAKKSAEQAKKVQAAIAKIEAAQKAAERKAVAAAKKPPKKKEVVAKKPAPPKPVAEEGLAAEAKTMTGLPANLRSKAVLLTPIAKKKVVVESSEVVPAVKPVAPKPKIEPKVEPETGGDEEEFVIEKKPKKVKAAEIPKVEMQVIKPVKAPKRGGLVPPPPPVIPSMMVAPPPPQVMAAPPKPKAAAPKKEPKVEPVKEDKPAEKPAEDDDFLLDWGGAKKKSK